MATELGFEAGSVTAVFAPSVSSPALGGWSDSLPERRSVRALVATRVSLVDAVVMSVTGSSVVNPLYSSGVIGAPAPGGRAGGTQALRFLVKTLPMITCLRESMGSRDPTFVPVGPHSYGDFEF